MVKINMSEVVQTIKESIGNKSFTSTTSSNNTIRINKTEYENLTTANSKVQEQQKEIADLRFQVLVLEEKIALLTYKRFVHSSEKHGDDRQASLFNEDEVAKTEATDDENADDKTHVKEHDRKKAGRKPLPENLPRKTILNDLDDAEKHCVCGKELVRIGEDTNEKLVVVPMQVYVEQTVTPKYVCPCCGKAKDDEDAPCTIRTAPARPAILPGSIATAQLLAYVFIAKFCDGLPYYRLEKQFERIGVSISRQDMANWQVAVFEKLTILFQLMTDHLKTGKVLRMDETTVHRQLVAA